MGSGVNQRHGDGERSIQDVSDQDLPEGPANGWRDHTVATADDRRSEHDGAGQHDSDTGRRSQRCVHFAGSPGWAVFESGESNDRGICNRGAGGPGGIAIWLYWHWRWRGRD